MTHVVLLKTVTDEAVIGLVGKYTELHDTYLSVVKALLHAALHCKRKLTVKWIDSSALDSAKKHKVNRRTRLHVLYRLPSLSLFSYACLDAITALSIHSSSRT